MNTATETTKKYESYPQYRDSGVDWLGEVPEEWTIKRLKTVLSRNDGGVWGEDFDDNGIIVLRSTEQTIDGEWCIEEPARRLLSHSEYAASRLRRGDLVVTKSSGSALHIGKTTIVTQEIEELNCCYSNFMQRLRVKSQNLPRFLYYIINGPIGRAQFVYGSNTTTGLANLNGEVIGNVIIALPSVSEQQAIVDFLDRRTGEIDELIAKKERVIELLREKRTALISHAVTKGLNPDAKMKDSRIDWLGNIPEHWEVKKGKYLFTILSGFAPEQFDFSDAANSIYLRVDDLNNEENGLYLKEGKARFILRDIPLYDKNIILFPKRGAAILTNKVKILGIKCLFDTNLMGLSVFKGKASIEYLSYCILSRRLGDIADTSTIPQINNKHIYPLCFPCPSLEEQSEIVSFLDRETSRIDALIAKVTEAIEKLKEYRTALISAAVTGKIDVREGVV